MKRIVAFAVGVATGMFLSAVGSELEYAIRRDVYRCSYKFPWSGQCSRQNGHKGEHF